MSLVVLDPSIREAGKLALMIHPRTELVATVNHFDNFKLWAAPIIDEAITDIFSRTEDFKTWDAYCEPGVFKHPIYSSYIPARNPVVIEIAREVYNHFQQQD